MSEEVKKAGRPATKKVETKEKVEDTTIDVVVENKVDAEKEALKLQNEQMAEMMKQMQAQMTMMQNQINMGGVAKVKNLPTKVKVVSLLGNFMNLVTSTGKIYKFPKFGDIATLRTSDLEDILSNQKFRQQAEDGFFYICDKEIVEDQELTEVYEKIHDKTAIEYIMKLADDNCVNMFASLSDGLKESVSCAMAEELNRGKVLDRNRLSMIYTKTNIDIEEIAKKLKDVDKYLEK